MIFRRRLFNSIFNKGKKLERANYGITSKFFIKLMGINFAQLYMLNESKEIIPHVNISDI